jgi:hypothetical protein
MGTEADQSGEEPGGSGGAAPAVPELPATAGSEVALDMGGPGKVSWGLVCSKSLIMPLLLVSQLCRVCPPFLRDP